MPDLKADAGLWVAERNEERLHDILHVPLGQPLDVLNAFDDAIVPRIALGDGWWWADGVVPSGYLPE